MKLGGVSFPILQIGDSGPEKAVACSSFTPWQASIEFRLPASWAEGRGWLFGFHVELCESLSSHKRILFQTAFTTLVLGGCITFFLVIKLIYINCRISGKYREVLVKRNTHLWSHLSEIITINMFTHFL